MSTGVEICDGSGDELPVQLPLLLVPGHFCPLCPASVDCGAQLVTPCLPDVGSRRSGGLEALHPARDDAGDWMQAVRGPALNIPALPMTLPTLPHYLFQVTFELGLAGHLGRQAALGIRSDAVILTDRVRPASEVREALHIRADQRLVLICFGEDGHLERIRRGGARLADELIAAEYDLLVSPSFATYSNYPRFDQLVNLKLSLIFFHELQIRGATVLPRFDWPIDADVDRAARWLNANPDVPCVAFDFMGRSSWAEWSLDVERLRRLDDLTDHRHHFFINGVKAHRKLVDLYKALPRSRLTLTAATMGPPPPDGSTSPRDPLGWQGRVAEVARSLAAAAEAAGIAEEAA